jgi:hypothetical protein
MVSPEPQWNIANVDDGWQSPHRLHSFLTIGGELVRIAGWHVLPGLWHAFGETVWEMLDQACGLRRFCWNVRTEHCHWMNSKAPKDTNYEAGWETCQQEDHRRFQAWLQDGSARVLADTIISVRRQCTYLELNDAIAHS